MRKHFQNLLAVTFAKLLHAKSASWAAALVAALAVAGCGGPGSTTEKFETIPLASIHTTSNQEGLQHVTLGGETLAGEKLPNQELVERFLNLLPRASNVFLGVAKDLNEAIEVALRFKGQSEVVLPKEGDKSQIWLIVFLGFRSSEPPYWNIDSVEYSQSKIRVSYSAYTPLLLSDAKTRDSHPYFYCIPLPELRPGKYDLELRDSTTKEVVLLRKVRFQVPER